MPRVTSITVLGAVLCLGLLPSVQASEPSNSAVRTTPVSVFDPAGYIPASADLKSIRFEGAKLVSIPTTLINKTDTRYCESVREPGGSAFCSSSEAGEFQSAYELTYSFNGSAMVSDETGQRHFEVTIYLAPNQLPSETRAALQGHKLGRAGMARYFAVKTATVTQTRPMADEARSSFCAGNWIEGAWTKTNSSCRDNIIYSTMEVPTGSIRVSVEPVALLSANR